MRAYTVMVSIALAGVALGVGVPAFGLVWLALYAVWGWQPPVHSLDAFGFLLIFLFALGWAMFGVAGGFLEKYQREGR